jgi:N utilization substance protein A
MKLNKEEILYIKAIGALAKVDAVDCVLGSNSVSFLVRPEQMGFAIGKNGSNIKRFKYKTGKNMDVFEYHPKAEDFVKNAFRDVKIESVKVNGDGNQKSLSIRVDSTNKRKILQNLGNLSKVRKIVKKTYDINDVKIM